MAPCSWKGRRTLQQIRTLSTLLSEKIEKAPNPHVAGQIDEFRTLTFVGLELYGLVTPTLEFWPITAVITTARWNVRDGLNVGASAVRIERVLGPPMEKTGAVLEYQGVKIFGVDRDARTNGIADSREVELLNVRAT